VRRPNVYPGVVPVAIQLAQAPQSVACSRASSTWNFAESSLMASPMAAFLKHDLASAGADTRAILAKARVETIKRSIVRIGSFSRHYEWQFGRGTLPQAPPRRLKNKCGECRFRE
jgi:hypothetical protein